MFGQNNDLRTQLTRRHLARVGDALSIADLSARSRLDGPNSKSSRPGTFSSHLVVGTLQANPMRRVLALEFLSAPVCSVWIRYLEFYPQHITL